jgi:hypothetical protein
VSHIVLGICGILDVSGVASIHARLDVTDMLLMFYCHISSDDWNLTEVILNVRLVCLPLECQSL